MPSHHIPRHTPDLPDSVDGGQEPKKSARLNLIMKNEILSKIDDIENDKYVVSNNDELPPSPAPIMYHSALQWLNSIKLPGDNSFPSSQKEERNQRSTGVDDLNDLGQMLKDLTDELDAKLYNSTTV